MRISTSQVWANSLSNLMLAQQRQADAGDKVATQRNATDLAGYGRGSEVISAYQTALTKTNGYLDTTTTVADRLTSQDAGMGELSDATSTAKDAIMSALATGSGTTLMLDMAGSFSSAVDGLNYKHNGAYVFAGGNDGSAPVKVTSMSQLTALTASTDAFTNGTTKKTSKIDPNTTIQTGFLASDLGGAMMSFYKDIQAYNDDPATGPFGDTLTDTQKTWLTARVADLTKAYNGTLNQQALNGTLQKRVESTQGALTNQASSLSSMVNSKTQADLASAYSDLQQAQVSVQASAQVLQVLNSSSLLNLLK